ncbi:MAG: spermidine synthase [Thermotogaceae bacterium]|jgi:spermidine synthase|nr:spermidine synthase [Thermotogaceae bacterium]
MSTDKFDFEKGKHLRYEEYFQGENNGLFIKIKELLFSKQSKYQRIDIFDSYDVGRVFALDGITQTIEKFEFMYHEMLVHVAMFSHPNPEKVLIIGGGDGGTLREVLRHRCVKEAVMCEIDVEVVLAAKEYLPSLSCAMNDERASLLFKDGAAYVSEFEDYFDVIIIDSTDPTAGEGGHLFTVDFYKRCSRALTDEGLLVAHTENPVYDANWLKMAYSRIEEAFEVTKMYTGFSPQYPSGFWTYTAGSKGNNPSVKVRDDESLESQLKYYNGQIHRACFILPVFLNDIIESKS